MGSSASKQYYEFTDSDRQNAAKKGKIIFNSHELLLETIFSGNKIEDAIRIIKEKQMYLKCQLIPDLIIQKIIQNSETSITDILDNPEEFEKFLLNKPFLQLHQVASFFNSTISTYSDEQIAKSIYLNLKNKIQFNISTIFSGLSIERCKKILRFEYDNNTLVIHIYKSDNIQNITHIISYVNLEYVPDINSWHGGTILHYSCLNNNINLIKLIVDRCPFLIYALDNYGLTPVHVYFIYNHKQINTEIINLFDTYDLTPLLSIKIKRRNFVDRKDRTDCYGSDYMCIVISKDLSFNDLINGHECYYFAKYNDVLSKYKILYTIVPAFTDEHKKKLQTTLLEILRNLLLTKL